MSPPNVSLVLIMVCFWITMWLVYRYLIQPVGRVLAARDGRIRGAEREWSSKHQDYLSATERLESEMDDAAREASQIRAELRQRAQEDRQARLDVARRQADDRLQAALAQIDDQADAAERELRERARDLARLFASALLDRDLREVRS